MRQTRLHRRPGLARSQNPGPDPGRNLLPRRPTSPVEQPGNTIGVELIPDHVRKAPNFQMPQFIVPPEGISFTVDEGEIVGEHTGELA